MSQSVPEIEDATGGHPFFRTVHLVEFIFFVFTRMPGESYSKRLAVAFV